MHSILVKRAQSAVRSRLMIHRIVVQNNAMVETRMVLNAIISVILTPLILLMRDVNVQAVTSTVHQLEAVKDQNVPILATALRVVVVAQDVLEMYLLIVNVVITTLIIPMEVIPKLKVVHPAILLFQDLQVEMPQRIVRKHARTVVATVLMQLMVVSVKMDILMTRHQDVNFKNVMLNQLVLVMLKIQIVLYHKINQSANASRSIINLMLMRRAQ